MESFIFNAQQRPTDRDLRKEALIQQIMGQGAPQPNSVGSGAVQGLNSLMGGLALRNHNQGPFPQAPEGGQVNPLQGLMNFFGGARGGLF